MPNLGKFYMYPKSSAIFNGFLPVGIFCRSWRMPNLGKFYMYPKSSAIINGFLPVGIFLRVRIYQTQMSSICSKSFVF